VQVPETFEDQSHLSLYHSHTNETPLSAPDLAYLVKPNVDCIAVRAINGDTFVARVGAGYRPSKEEFEEVEDQIRRDVDISLLDDPEFHNWSLPERNYMAIREETYRLARHFGWTLEGGGRT
jgi:proteasome lid subunit RPN8/RPN11